MNVSDLSHKLGLTHFPPLSQDPRFYKDTTEAKKNMNHNSTSYNFMSENAPVEQRQKPNIENARNMNADFNRVDGRYSYHPHVVTASPKKPAKRG